MPRAYKNPPIEEAVVEIQFSSGSDSEWNLTIPGHLHARLIGEYSGQPRQQQIVQQSFVMGIVGTGPIQQTQQTLGKVQFPSEDGKRLVAVGPNLLSIHSLRPYDGWSNMFPRIERALEAYCDVAKPANTVRIGVRYINVVRVPEPEVPLETFFTHAAMCHSSLPGNRRQFVHVDHFEFIDGARWQLSFASHPHQPNTFVLDVDLIDTAPHDLSGLAERIDELRNRERGIFEALITDRLREVFDAS